MQTLQTLQCLHFCISLNWTCTWCVKSCLWRAQITLTVCWHPQVKCYPSFLFLPFVHPSFHPSLWCLGPWFTGTRPLRLSSHSTWSSPTQVPPTQSPSPPAASGFRPAPPWLGPHHHHLPSTLPPSPQRGAVSSLSPWAWASFLEADRKGESLLHWVESTLERPAWTC